MNAYEVHGVDYYFLSRAQIEILDPAKFIVQQVRSDLQAIDLSQVGELFQHHDLIVAEVFHTLGRSLMEWIRKQSGVAFEVRSVFVSPLSAEEIEEAAHNSGVPPEEVVYRTMKAKLARRGEDNSGKVEERVGFAFGELQDACYYSRVIVNHAGEDDKEEWTDPLGQEAQRVLAEFVSVLRD